MFKEALCNSIVINQTQTLTSGHSSNINGHSEIKSVNPRDIISGYLTKKGFIVLDKIDDFLIEKTLIVNYGESGKRSFGFGYATETTIQFITAKSKELVASITAEGCGDTEADDIKKAIRKAINALFSQSENNFV